jgi:diguanylate cyclase (GGDEF)-like protein
MFNRIHRKTVSTLSSRSPVTVIIISLCLLTLLGWIDYITGDYSLIVFYLVPVSIVAWFVNRPAGILFCFLSLAVRFIADESPSSFSMQNTAMHYWNECVELMFLLIMSLLFSTLRQTLETEKSLASIDPLTGVLNRRAFFESAEYEINRSVRYGHPITVAYIDLDNFKVINDRLGHAIGDKLLVSVSKTISDNIRSTDIIARFGGDEFVILLPETPSDAALPSLGKIRDLLKQAMQSNRWDVTFSIGAVTYLKPPATAEEIVKRADTLMYDVKRSGKDRLLHIDLQESNHG